MISTETFGKLVRCRHPGLVLKNTIDLDRCKRGGRGGGFTQLCRRGREKPNSGFEYTIEPSHREEDLHLLYKA